MKVTLSLTRPHHFAGCMPIPIDTFLDEDRLGKIAEDMPRIKIEYIRDIRGGMRTPHFHWGEEIVILDRARLKAIVGQVARELAGRRAEEVAGYIHVMQPVGNLVSNLPTPIP